MNFTRQEVEELRLLLESGDVLGMQKKMLFLIGLKNAKIKNSERFYLLKTGLKWGVVDNNIMTRILLLRFGLFARVEKLIATIRRM